MTDPTDLPPSEAPAADIFTVATVAAAGVAGCCWVANELLRRKRGEKERER